MKWIMGHGTSRCEIRRGAGGHLAVIEVSHGPPHRPMMESGRAEVDCERIEQR
jgi:hypothetical protein